MTKQITKQKKIGTSVLFWEELLIFRGLRERLKGTLRHMGGQFLLMLTLGQVTRFARMWTQGVMTSISIREHFVNLLSERNENEKRRWSIMATIISCSAK